MSSAKKSKIESNSNTFCNYCINLEEKSEEMIVLTDHRLSTIYQTCDNVCPIADTPQHRITGFTIHDSDRRFCWFDSKPIEKGYKLFLCGYVLPIVSNCDPVVNESNQMIDNNENSHRIKAQMIGPIQEWWFAGFDGGPNLIVGVESEFASYILCEPHSHYFNLFTKRTKNMFLTKLVIQSLLRNTDSCYEDLIQTIEESGHDFTEESLIHFSPFIIEQIKSFDSTAEEDENLLSETSAFKTLVQLSGVSLKSNILRSESTHSHMRPIARVDARRLVNSDTLTCSTPLVTKFFDSIFKDVIECEDNYNKSPKDFKNSPKIKNNFEIQLNKMNKKINWIGSAIHTDKFVRTSYYSTLRINEITYSLGEFVNFRENDNSLKLGRIIFMYNTSDKQKLCHIHYFCYGKETILAETAPNSIVFMTNKCDNIDVENIESKIDVFLSNDFELESENTNSNRYYCSKFYIKKSGRFEDLPNEVFDTDIKCINCLVKEKTEKQKTPQLEEDISEGSVDLNLKNYRKLIFKNQSYSVGDCALFSSDAFDINYFNYENKEDINNCKEYDQQLYPERYRKQFTDYIKGLNNDLPKTLNIGFITQIYKQSIDSNEETKLLVNIFYRPQNIYQNYKQFRSCDRNLLFWSNQQFVVDINSIRGICKVIYSKISPKTNFYIETNFFYFNQCYDYQKETFFDANEELINKFVIECTPKTNVCDNKFNVLDLFSGCGGLSYGFHKLGLVSNLWAIEKDCSALKSFKANFSSAQVFQEDVNYFLDQLIKGVKYDKSGQKYPQKGDIDLILGGPPCQGFSGMNRFSSRHYSQFKNSLVVSFLSFIDYFRPKYFVFENVRNFALFKKSMVLKLMLSCLISMGYQCQFAILQSGSYGLPQTRRRTVIMGASTGSQLPLFPEATHVFSRRQCQLSVNIDNHRYVALKNTSFAQFSTITVDDAISDLLELNENYSSNIVRHYKQNDDTITHYQRILRDNCDERLFEHFCKELGELCRLRIKHIPRTLGSDWRDLPNISLTLTDGTVIPKLKYKYEDSKNGRSKYKDLRGVCLCAQGLKCNGNECRQENTLIPWCLVHTANRQYHWSGLYGRLAFNGYFPTTVTNPEPISKQGRVLHPTQDRIISVRESARSQGFPDEFRFFGNVSEKYRQIGNAVPIPLSFAISRQFIHLS